VFNIFNNTPFIISNVNYRAIHLCYVAFYLYVKCSFILNKLYLNVVLGGVEQCGGCLDEEDLAFSQTPAEICRQGQRGEGRVLCQHLLVQVRSTQLEVNVRWN